MPHPSITVVISGGRSENPAKRKLEQDLAAAAAADGLPVLFVPHVYDLAADGPALSALRAISGDMVVFGWLFPRAIQWVLDRNGIRGQEGVTELVDESEEDEDEEEDNAADEADGKERVAATREIPSRSIYCLDLRVRGTSQPFVDEIRRIASVSRPSHESDIGPSNGNASDTYGAASNGTPSNGASSKGAGPNGAHTPPSSPGTVDLLSWLSGNAPPEQIARYLQPLDVRLPDAAAGSPTGPALSVKESAGRRWYPVIDYSRCTNCMECIDFCLFGVYGVDRVETILVEQPDNCRKGCPACSRVCPENAIIFPEHKTPAIAGSPVGEAGAFKIDLSKLFGGQEGDALTTAVDERDRELVAAGRDAVGMSIGIPKRQSEKPDRPKDELDDLLDKLDDLSL